MSFLLQILTVIFLVQSILTQKEGMKPIELCENIYTYYADEKLAYRSMKKCVGFFKATNLTEYCEKERCKHFMGNNCTKTDDPDLYFVGSTARTTSVIACIGHLCQNGCSKIKVDGCLDKCLDNGQCFSEKKTEDIFQKKYEFECYAERAQKYYNDLDIPDDENEVKYNIDLCHLLPLDDQFNVSWVKCIVFFNKFNMKQFCETNPYRCPYRESISKWDCSRKEHDVETDSGKATYKLACAAWYCQLKCENDTKCAEECRNPPGCTNGEMAAPEILSCYLVNVWRFTRRKTNPIVKTRDECQLLSLHDGAFQTNMAECIKLFLDFDLDNHCRKTSYCEKFENKLCDSVEGEGGEEKTYLAACMALYCYRVCREYEKEFVICMPFCIGEGRCSAPQEPQQTARCFFESYKSRRGALAGGCPLVFYDQQELGDCLTTITQESITTFCSEKGEMCKGLQLGRCTEAQTLTTGQSLKVICTAKECSDVCYEESCFFKCFHSCSDAGTVDSFILCQDKKIKEFQRSEFKVGCPILKEGFSDTDLFSCVDSLTPFVSQQFCSRYNFICNEFEEKCDSAVSKYKDVTQLACVVKRCDDGCNSEEECVINCIKPTGCLDLPEASEQLSCIEKMSRQVINAYKAICPILKKDADSASIVDCTKNLAKMDIETFCKNNEIICKNVKSKDCETFTETFDQLDTRLICVAKNCKENCQEKQSNCVSSCYETVERCSQEIHSTKVVKCIVDTVRQNAEKATLESKATHLSTFLLTNTATAIIVNLILKLRT